MVKSLLILLLLTAVTLRCPAQSDTIATGVNKSRLWVTASANALFWTGSYIALNKAWYAGYPRSSFHFFNDNLEWNQMDKAGHAWTSCNLSGAAAKMWQWTGLSNNAAAVVGGATGLLYQSIIELQDGYSSAWGFSWGDMGANAFGSGLFTAQQCLWKEQRVTLKWSFTSYRYPTGTVDRRNDLFGGSLAERLLKDYNAQTYWASVNIASFFPDGGLPGWLNLAVGYGSEGMLGARDNRWTDADGREHDYSSLARTRRWYLSPDIDLTRIPTRSKFLRSAFFVLNIIKVPAPALELNGKGKLLGHALRF